MVESSLASQASVRSAQQDTSKQAEGCLGGMSYDVLLLVMRSFSGYCRMQPLLAAHHVLIGAGPADAAADSVASRPWGDLRSCFCFVSSCSRGWRSFSGGFSRCLRRPALDVWNRPRNLGKLCWSLSSCIFNQTSLLPTVESWIPACMAAAGSHRGPCGLCRAVASAPPKCGVLVESSSELPTNREGAHSRARARARCASAPPRLKEQVKQVELKVSSGRVLNHSLETT